MRLYLGELFTRRPSTMMSLVLVFSLGLVFSSLVQGQRVQVGVLPTLAHRVSGTLYVVNNKTLFIENFNYDGGGPDAFLYYYPPGAQPNIRGNGLIIPISDTMTFTTGLNLTGSDVIVQVLPRQEKFQLGVGFTNTPFTINLPEGVYACDIGTFTIWCRAARQFFTSIQIPSTIFTNSSQTSNDVILCVTGSGTLQESGTLQTVSFVSLVTAIITLFFFSY